MAGTTGKGCGADLPCLCQGDIQAIRCLPQAIPYFVWNRGPGGNLHLVQILVDDFGAPIPRKILDVWAIRGKCSHLNDFGPDRQTHRLFFETIGIYAATVRFDFEVRTGTRQQEQPVALPDLFVTTLSAACAERLPLGGIRRGQILVHPPLDFIDPALSFRPIDRKDLRAPSFAGLRGSGLRGATALLPLLGCCSFWGTRFLWHGVNGPGNQRGASQ